MSSTALYAGGRIGGMRARARAATLLLTVWLLLFGDSLPGLVPSTAAQPAGGRVLAVIGRQIGFVNFEAPRPRTLTTFSAPAFALDVAAVPSTSMAIFSVAEPFGGYGDASSLGGDLLSLDLSGADAQPALFLMRDDPSEWLGAPAWLPDGSAVLFQREDVQAGSDPYAGFSGVRYPSRVEIVSASGVGRRVLIGYGHQPSPAPDGSEIAYVRLSPDGTMLIAHDLGTDAERILVKSAALPDLAYPRYSPDGSRIAFVATTAAARGNPVAVEQAGAAAGQLPANWFALVGGANLSRTTAVTSWFAPATAYAHGLPWNLWLVSRDGSGLRELADLSEDDASLAWSPDGSQIFVYGSSGARLVDVATGTIDVLRYIAGFGAVSWLP